MGKGRDKKKNAAKKAGKVTAGKGDAKTASHTKKNEKKKKKRELFATGSGGDEVKEMLAEMTSAATGPAGGSGSG
eukprot:SAG22_NODE_6839_length_805_cov_1.804533_1_plen_74_part_01